MQHRSHRETEVSEVSLRKMSRSRDEPKMGPHKPTEKTPIQKLLQEKGSARGKDFFNCF